MAQDSTHILGMQRKTQMQEDGGLTCATHKLRARSVIL